MRPRAKLSWSVLTVLMLLMAGIIQAQAGTFTDNFNFGASPFWGNERGNWTANGGVYRALDPSNSPPTYSSLPWNLSDFTFNVDINALEDGGIWLRRTGAPGSENGVLLITRWSWQGHDLYWDIYQNGVITHGLLNRVLEWQSGGNPHVKVVVNGDSYSAFVNYGATPATTLNTLDYEVSFPRGRAGLYCFSMQSFDNVALMGVDVPDFSTAPWSLLLLD